MKVVDMVLNSMMPGEYRTHYKKGNANFFLMTLSGGDYLLDRVTKGSTCGVCCGSEDKINSFVKDNGLKLVGILHK